MIKTFSGVSNKP